MPQVVNAMNECQDISDRIIAVIKGEGDDELLVLLAQDHNYVSYAKQLIRQNPSRVADLDGVCGIKVTVLNMSVDQWNVWGGDGPPPVPESKPRDRSMN